MKIALVIIIIAVAVFTGAAVVGSKIGSKPILAKSSLSALSSQTGNSVDFEDQQEILAEILSEIRELRAELNNLSKREPNANHTIAAVQDTESENWWERKQDVQPVEDNLQNLFRQSPRKRDYSSEEEYQQGILDFQAQLDAYALSDKNQIELERKQSEYLQATINAVEEDLGESLN